MTVSDQSLDRIEIQPCGPIHKSVRPPGSKSLTNRALPCAALANGISTLTGVLDSEDTRVMVECLERLGISIEADWPAKTVRVIGCAGKIPSVAAELFVENSGTTIRFLAALCAIGHGAYRLDGISRMRERPIGDLLDAMQQLGVESTCESPHGCPPVAIRADGIKGGIVNIRGNISSQYLSGLLMAVPYAQQETRIVVDGELVSQPYVRMTLELMRSFDVHVETESDLTQFVIPGQQTYSAQNYAIEPDASAASYFWAAAAMTGGRVLVEGLHRDALQGDVAFCDVLERMGCTVSYEPSGIAIEGGDLRGIEVDMNPISDTVQTLAAVALFADGPTTVRGVAHNRHKETDRISDLATELRRVGATVEEFEDGLKISPGQLQGAEIETYNDHRMAMSMALIGLRQPGIVIKDPGCTRKTFPDYFERLAELCK